MRHLIFDQLTSTGKRQANHIAILVGERSYTFGEVDALASKVSSFLLSRELKRGDRVGIMAPKSAEYVCSQYGTMRAGGCYVPIDVHFPLERVFQIVEDCQIRILFGTEAALAEIARAKDKPTCLTQFVAMDSKGETLAAFDGMHSWSQVEASSPSDGPRPIDTDLAYIMYTSGSTGKPKGVMLSHRNILTYVDWCIEELKLTSSDVMVNVAPFTFDISGMEIFNMAATGATMVLVEDQQRITTVLDAVQRHKATFLATVPTVIGTMVNNPRVFSRYDLSTLRTVISGAAVCPPVFLKTLHEHLPSATLYNLYGPTEATIYCLYHRVDKPESIQTDRPLPIGKPFENTEAYVVDADGNEAKPGEAGELILRGSHVALGYFNNPEKTDAAFKGFPLQPYLNELVYFTGDVACRDEDGVFHFMGRNDDMVKSRGYRIEINEIDLALSTMTGDVQSCAVVAVPDELVENKLIAIIVRKPESQITEEEVKAGCKDRLPAYMVPDQVVFHETLPLTSSGKINKKALIEMLQS